MLFRNLALPPPEMMIALPPPPRDRSSSAGRSRRSRRPTGSRSSHASSTSKPADGTPMVGVVPGSWKTPFPLTPYVYLSSIAQGERRVGGGGPPVVVAQQRALLACHRGWMSPRRRVSKKSHGQTISKMFFFLRQSNRWCRGLQ